MDSLSNTKYLQQDGSVNLTLNNISLQFRVSLKGTDDKVLFVFPITLDLLEQPWTNGPENKRRDIILTIITRCDV